MNRGSILEDEGLSIGIVEGVQGASWTELTISGLSTHAGTTPMRLRRDAGHAAAAIAVGVRPIAGSDDGNQLATVGAITLEPNLVNVVPERARMTMDLRHPSEAALRQAEWALDQLIREVSAAEHVTIESRRLARFEPVAFDAGLVARIEAETKR